jgi:hypothetical protein
MFDEPYSFEDSVMALSSEWTLLAESYERHAADLLRAAVAGGSHPLGDFARDLSDVMRHAVMAAQLTACVDSLMSCLEESESKKHDRAT